MVVIMVIGIIPTAMEVKNHSEADRTKQVLVTILKLYIILFAFIYTCNIYYLLILSNKQISEIRRLINIGSVHTTDMYFHESTQQLNLQISMLKK